MQKNIIKYYNAIT